MNRVALDSNAKTEIVDGALDAMTDAAGRVSGRSVDGAADARARANELIDEMRRSVVELHSSNESSFSRVHQISTLSSPLPAGCGAGCREFSAGLVFSPAVPLTPRGLG